MIMTAVDNKLPGFSLERWMLLVGEQEEGKLERQRRRQEEKLE